MAVNGHAIKRAGERMVFRSEGGKTAKRYFEPVTEDVFQVGGGYLTSAADAAVYLLKKGRPRGIGGCRVRT
jgi:hypothetical protein